VSTLIAVGVGVVAVAIGFAARSAIAGFFKMTDTSPVIAALFGLALFAVVMVQRGVFTGAHRFAEFAISGSIETVMKVVAGVALAGLFGATGGLVGIDIGLGLALLYNVIVFAIRFGPRASSMPFDAGVVSRVVTHGGAGQLTLTILMFYDVPLVKHLFDPRQAGLFAAAALAGRAILSAVSFVPTLVLPKAAARLGAGRSPVPLLAAALCLAGGAVAFGAVAGALWPRLVVTILAGPAFGDAAPLVLLYILASGALGLANVVAAYKMGLHRFDFVGPALAIAAVEILTIWVWHPSLAAVVIVLAVGHTTVLGATLFRATSWVGSRAVLSDQIAEVVT
jgi:O-antigen/teichoic acid export membrane protein